jgi:putative spermidine/putrescine transport system permease protein
MAINLIDTIFLLSFAYVVLVLPFAYRALDAGLSAIDVKTLSEAARSLGAGWGTVMFRVIAPNMSSALLNACLLSVALVLGEFTFANLLSYLNLQVEIFQLGLANAGTSIAVAVASLLFAFILLVILSFVGRARARVAPERAGLPFPGVAGGGQR